MFLHEYASFEKRAWYWLGYILFKMQLRWEIDQNYNLLLDLPNIKSFVMAFISTHLALNYCLFWTLCSKTYAKPDYKSPSC